ncbi:MAG: CHAD domain-containing protein [Opitutus sp.]
MVAALNALVPKPNRHLLGQGYGPGSKASPAHRQLLADHATSSPSKYLGPSTGPLRTNLKPLHHPSRIIPSPPEWRGVLSYALQESLRRHEQARRDFVREGKAHDLHDFRVETRRLLALSSLAFESGAKGFRDTRRSLKRCLRDTADCRDIEVLLRLVSDLREGFRAVGKFFRRLRRKKCRATDRAKRQLDEHKRKVFRGVQTMISALSDPTNADPSGTAMRTLRGSAGDVARLNVSIRQSEEQLHRARVKVKQLRYIIEASGDMLRGAKQRLATLVRAQHAMGEVHDLSVLLAHLDKFTVDRPQERRRMQEARASILVRHHWRRARLEIWLPSMVESWQDVRVTQRKTGNICALIANDCGGRWGRQE